MFSEEELVDMAMKEAFQVCCSVSVFDFFFFLVKSITCIHHLLYGIAVCRTRNVLVVLNRIQKANPMLGKLRLLGPHMCILSELLRDNLYLCLSVMLCITSLCGHG